MIDPYESRNGTEPGRVRSCLDCGRDIAGTALARELKILEAFDGCCRTCSRHRDKLRPAGKWRDRAACTGADPRLFDTGTRDIPWSARQTAWTYCASCPVRLACHAEAERDGDVGVIRGGHYRVLARGKTVEVTSLLGDEAEVAA